MPRDAPASKPPPKTGTPPAADTIRHLRAELAILRQCGLTAPPSLDHLTTGEIDADPEVAALLAVLEDCGDPALSGLLVEAALRDVEKHVATLAGLVEPPIPTEQ